MIPLHYLIGNLLPFSNQNNSTQYLVKKWQEIFNHMAHCIQNIITKMKYPVKRRRLRNKNFFVLSLFRSTIGLVTYFEIVISYRMHLTGPNMIQVCSSVYGVYIIIIYIYFFVCIFLCSWIKIYRLWLLLIRHNILS